MLLCLSQVWHHLVKLMTGLRLPIQRLFIRQVPQWRPGAVSLLSQGREPKKLKGIWELENQIVSRWHTFHHTKNTPRKILEGAWCIWRYIISWGYHDKFKKKKNAGKETTVLHFHFSIRKRGNVCCQCESIYNMFVLHTTGEWAGTSGHCLSKIAQASVYLSALWHWWFWA